MSATTEIPQQLWDKIEAFQKRGGLQNVKGMIEGVGAMRQNNHGIMQQMMQVIDQEEQADNQMRNQHGQKWNRLPSNALNAQFKQQISDLQQKALVAEETDKKLESKFQTQGEQLQLLTKSKNELSQMIPQSAGQKEIAENPVIVRYRGIC